MNCSENGNTEHDPTIVSNNNNNNTTLDCGQYMEKIMHTTVNDQHGRVNQLHTNAAIQPYGKTTMTGNDTVKSVQKTRRTRITKALLDGGETIDEPNKNNNNNTMVNENCNKIVRASRIRVTKGITLSSTVLDNNYPFESRNFSNFPNNSESVNNTLSRNLYSSKRVMRLSVAASTPLVLPLSSATTMSSTSVEDLTKSVVGTTGDFLNKSFPTSRTKISSSSQTMATQTTSPSTSATTVFVQHAHKTDKPRVLANGTLMGALVVDRSSTSPTKTSQPSLTIQVNQGDGSDHTTNINTTNKNVVNKKNTNEKDVSNQNINQKTSGVSVVNCYRAVPVNIVNQNNNNNQEIDSENVEENQSQVDKNSSENRVNNNNKNNNLDAIQLDTSGHESRTFTSTEAQTDDLLAEDLAENKNPTSADPAMVHHQQTSPQQSQSQAQNSQNDAISREQRRRERRERRQSRRPPHPHPNHHHLQQTHPSQLRAPPFDYLPDILNSSLPPPYSTLPGAAGPIAQPPIVSSVNVGPPEDLRYAFSIPVIRR